MKTHDIANTEDWWSRVPPLQALVLNSAVAEAVVDSTKHTLVVRGYAVGGPSGQVESVEVSTDKGASWKPAQAAGVGLCGKPLSVCRVKRAMYTERCSAVQ